MTSSDPAFLLLLPSGEVPEQSVVDALSGAGLDARGLQIRLRGEGPVVAGRGGADSMSRAREALARAGMASVAVTAAEARALPAVEVAGGVSFDGSAISLRVHGKPAGPPPGEPLLLLFGDLGRDDAQGSSSARPGDTLKQRILRAVYPVIDIVWTTGRMRVPLRGISFRGLPGAGVSGPENLVLLIQGLAAQSGGAVLDVGFRGQDVPIEPLRGAQEPLEGADRERLALFERYAAAAALAFARGLYPSAVPGQLREPAPLADRRDAPRTPAAPGSSPRTTTSPVPWIRKSTPGHRFSWSLRSILPFTPVIFFVLFHACVALSPRTEGRGASVVAGILLAAAGIGLVISGLRALARRERLRAVPTSKVRSLPMGAAEVAGRVVATASFKAPYSRVPCVWYRFEVEERGGGEGEEKHYGWHVIQRGGSGEVPFRVEDVTGSVLIQPAGARIETPPRTIALDDRQRVREWTLAQGELVFVSGEAHRRSAAEGVSGGADTDDIFIGAGADGFLTISPHSHDAQERRLAIQTLLSFLGGVVAIVLAVLVFAS